MLYMCCAGKPGGHPSHAASHHFISGISSNLNITMVQTQTSNQSINQSNRQHSGCSERVHLRCHERSGWACTLCVPTHTYACCTAVCCKHAIRHVACIRPGIGYLTYGICQFHAQLNKYSHGTIQYVLYSYVSPMRLNHPQSKVKGQVSC